MSEASAPDFGAASKLFLQNPDRGAGETRLVFRSSAQLARASDDQVRALIRAADVLVVGAIWGDQAARLLRLLPQSDVPTVVPLHGDAQLLRFARFDGRPAFPGLDPEAAKLELSAAIARLSNERGETGQLSEAVEGRDLLAQARRYRDGRGANNLAHLFQWLLHPHHRSGIPGPVPNAALRMLRDDRLLDPKSPALDGPSVALLDYAYGDQAGHRELHGALCDVLGEQGLGCFSVLARWGAPGIDALAALVDSQRAGRLDLRAVVLLQDFVVGGGAGAERASELLRALDVPVLKGLRMADRSVGAWRASEDGLPDDSVHYRLAMPELQGAGQGAMLAAAGPAQVDAATGLELRPLQVIPEEVAALGRRIQRWSRLRELPNDEKRVAVVYYNHPPGRHNIGADNLDVPASLLSILRRLQRAGYDTGELPADALALLDLLQERGVNLPEDGEALRAMAPKVARMGASDYRAYFETLPAPTRMAMEQGPLGALRSAVEAAMADRAEPDAVRKRVERVLGDVKHLLEGAVHPSRDVALASLEQLQAAYADLLEGAEGGSERVRTVTNHMAGLGIEGLGGWGDVPGQVMVSGDELVLPGLGFGKVFVGPQPPRGWELSEELLHANLAFPPPHQYLAFYEYLRSVHRADAVVHVGRHSTYEFLPGRRTGLGQEDFPLAVLADLPSVYLYIVDGVGEGIQAKRRGQAVIVDHLTPSLRTTPLYDELLSLRQLVETYESNAGVEGHAGQRALQEIRATIARLNLEEELTASMLPELEARGIRFEEVDGELLVHEVGHYLTKLQERFMPHGLHVFAEPWSEAAVDRMLQSMAGDEVVPPPAWRDALVQSPDREAEAMLAGLRGGFVSPGPGNDPVRTPEALPTGRNFHALDASLLPTRLGYQLGAELAAKARAESPGKVGGAEAVVLWASDAVRDEGAMVAFGMDMLGVVPRWNGRGIVQGLERVPLEGTRVRRDTTFVASGLFRDLYGHLIGWLDQAVLVALAGSAQTIRNEYPRLTPALDAALEPLREQGEVQDEPLGRNQIAAHWVESTLASLGSGADPARVGPLAAARVFGDAPGSYGTGVNRLAERSGAWTDRSELADTYLRRMGHAYGGGRAGIAAHDALQEQLERTEHTYLGRASHLYGVLDNNDVFDYLGGLGLAIEHVRGEPPRARVVQHADPENAGLEGLPSALMQELRGRHLNPEYLKPLMEHGYAGARTMGSGFVENLWGWQVTSPHIVKGWVWDEVKAVYLDDRYGIGLDDFLARGHNVQVRTNMQAILLVAAHKGFWEPDPATRLALSEEFARAVIEHGLPGSGHTRPDHPMMADVLDRLDPDLAESFEQTLRAAKGAEVRSVASELRVNVEPQANTGEDQASPSSGGALAAWGLLLFALAVVLGGVLYGRRRTWRD